MKKKTIADSVLAFHLLLLLYNTVMVLWFFVSLSFNVFVAPALIITAWVIFIQGRVIGACPLSVWEDKLRGRQDPRSFVARVFHFLGIKVRDDRKFWQTLGKSIVAIVPLRVLISIIF